MRQIHVNHACALVLALGGGVASADVIPGLFNTGVDSAGTPLINSATTVDSHYVISANPDVSPTGADGTTHLEDETAYPIVGPWLDNSATAKWIAPRFNTDPSAGGTYSYTTTFTLPATADLTSATITGGWATDDGGLGITLNGNATTAANATGFSALVPFTISDDFFLVGVNTLTFNLNNGGSYTGLYVDNLAGTFATTPEPASFTLLGIGGLLLSRRRRV